VKRGDKVRIIAYKLDDTPTVAHGQEGRIEEIAGSTVPYLLLSTEFGSGQYRAMPDEVVLIAAPAPQAMGYTGDVCMKCGGSRITRAGACGKCEDCGEPTGCS
jgi:hypothetical protein